MHSVFCPSGSLKLLTFNFQTEYLVKWTGYSAFSSWDDEENLTTDLIRYRMLFVFVTLHGKTGIKVIARSQHASTLKQKNLALACFISKLFCLVGHTKNKKACTH